MKKIFFLLLLCAAYAFPEGITWTNISSSFQLPEGVEIYKGERSSPLLKIWYIKADLNNKNLAIKPYLSTVSSKKEIITTFLPRVNAIAGVNGGFFDITTGASYSACVVPDNVQAKNIAAVTRNSLSYNMTRSFFGITETREMSVNWIYHFGNRISDIYRYDQPTPNKDGFPASAPSLTNGKTFTGLLVGIGGGPTLVKNGKVNVTYTEEVFWGSGVGLDNGDPRTAVGYTKDNHCIMICADGRQAASNGIGLTELAQVMIDLGCVEAMNLDGGGSTQMAVGGKLVNVPSETRPVPTILAVVSADSVPFLPPVYFNKIIDNEDPEARVYGSDWNQTTIAGYWGNTPAVYHAKGLGNNYVEFKPEVKKAAKYQIYAWWTAAVNRGKDTPFIIKTKNRTDTVRVDQTLNGGKWNDLGSFSLEADTNNAIIVSDAATNGDVVVADAVRILSFDSTTAVTGVESGRSYIPGNFLLFQNYPNPFNPSTNIEFALSKSSKVMLKVYDILGREIKTLINEEKPAGTHSLQFDAGRNHLTSGVYFYRLIAGGFSETRKMVLLR
jgi:hypothetical protein